MPWRPSEPGEKPTLGWQCLDWISENLASPDRAEYQPFVLYPEQARFLLNFYEIDPVTGKRRYTRGVFCRPRGFGKSPMLAAICCLESLGPVVFDGWDAQGQPVGVPWSKVRTPLVQVAAVSEIQTKNTWTPLLEMLQNGPVVDNYPGLEPNSTFVNLPIGRIEPITSSARSVKGNRAVFAVLDQSEEWVKSNGGLTLADTMRINAAKVGGSTIESPNAFTPGDESVAEGSYQYWQAIKDGRTKDNSLLYDHREAPAKTNLYDLDSLRKGLLLAYGDAAIENGGHVDLDRIIATIMDPTLDEQVARADFLNQITHATDSWLTAPDWNACAAPKKILHDQDAITLGFDGGETDDSTALVACRLEDGHIQLLGCWEKPPGRNVQWEVPRTEIEAAVYQAMDRYQVVGMYADPAYWQTYIDSWQRQFGRKMRIGIAGRNLEWKMNRPTAVVEMLERFHTAVVTGELTHDGGSVLTRHALNARRKLIPQGVSIRKEHPKSPKKIDAVVAAALAFEARNDAYARKAKPRRATPFLAQRVQ